VRFEHLYVHVPFCARRCVYCDFSIAVRSSVPVDAFVTAIARELATRHRDSSLELETLYFGGGTPSKLGPAGVDRLLGAIRERATLRPGAEVTLEVNPEDVTTGAVTAWLRAGITRLSIGVQSFDDTVLAWMHRTHDAAGARRAVEQARSAGATNVSIDLIFAVPSHLGRRWQRDLDVAVSLDLPHLSVYGLTVEERTPLGKWVARQAVTEAPEDSFAAEFHEAHRALTGAGLEHYEVSNYGRAGQHSRHNRAYWRRAPYVGVGPSAHEFDGHSRRWNADAYAKWHSTVSSGGDPVEGSERLDEDQVAAEAVYLALRTTKGLDFMRESDEVAAWARAGWVILENGTLKLTADGWLRLDSIAAGLTHVRSRY